MVRQFLCCTAFTPRVLYLCCTRGWYTLMDLNLIKYWSIYVLCVIKYFVWVEVWSTAIPPHVNTCGSFDRYRPLFHANYGNYRTISNFFFWNFPLWQKGYQSYTTYYFLYNFSKNVGEISLIWTVVVTYLPHITLVLPMPILQYIVALELLNPDELVNSVKLL